MCSNPPAVKQPSRRPVEWIEAKDELGLYVFGLRSKSYQNLAKNTADMLTALDNQVTKTWYYWDCIQKYNAKIEKTEDD